MDNSIANFELSESTVRVGSDSDPSSEKSENFEEILDDVSSTGSNENKAEEDFDNNLPDTVTLLHHPVTGAKVYLVGTAHFSQESKDDVIKVIKQVRPHTVVLELCDARTSILTMDEKTVLEEAKNINMENIMATIRRNGAYYGVTYLLLLNLSAHLTKQIGMAPGGEFRVAFQEAQKLGNCRVQLGDRPIKITLLRALAKLSWFQTVKLGWHLIFSRDPISVEEVEKCKRRDMLEQLLADMSGEYPALGTVFVDERDIFLTFSLQQAATSELLHTAPGTSSIEPIRVVGVVGIGHVLGITKLWPRDQHPYVKDILFVPPLSLTTKIIKIGFKLSLVSLVGFLAYRYIPMPRVVRETSHHAFEKLIDMVPTRNCLLH